MHNSTTAPLPSSDEQCSELEAMMPNTIVLGMRDAGNECNSPTIPPYQFWTQTSSCPMIEIASHRVPVVPRDMVGPASAQLRSKINAASCSVRSEQSAACLSNPLVTRQCLRRASLSNTQAAICDLTSSATSSISRAAQYGSTLDLMEELTGENEITESPSMFRYRSPTDLRMSPTSRALQRIRRRSRPFLRASNSRRLSEYQRSVLSYGAKLRDQNRHHSATLRG